MHILPAYIPDAAITSRPIKLDVNSLIDSFESEGFRASFDQFRFRAVKKLGKYSTGYTSCNVNIDLSKGTLTVLFWSDFHPTCSIRDRVIQYPNKIVDEVTSCEIYQQNFRGNAKRRRSKAAYSKAKDL